MPDDSSFAQVLKVSARTGRNLATLRTAIADELARLKDRWSYRLPASWLRAKAAIESRRSARSMPRAHFEQLCVAISVRYPGALLRYLHDSGFLYYRDGLFQDRLVLDQNWFIDMAYNGSQALAARRAAIILLSRRVGLRPS